VKGATERAVAIARLTEIEAERTKLIAQFEMAMSSAGFDEAWAVHHALHALNVEQEALAVAAPTGIPPAATEPTGIEPVLLRPRRRRR
jgi:hypothetical protein